MDGKGLFGGDGRGVSSTEPVLGEVLRGDAKTGSLRLPGADANPFQEQLNEASQRLRNAQLDVMRSGGARAKMELQIAQQAFQTAHTLAITFDSKKPSQNFSRESGYDTDSSQSVSSASDSRRSHPYARRLSKRERNKISANKYRQKKKQYVTELETKCQTLHNTVDSLKTAVAALKSENKLLKEQMGFLKQLLQHRNGGAGGTNRGISSSIGNTSSSSSNNQTNHNNNYNSSNNTSTTNNNNNARGMNTEIELPGLDGGGISFRAQSERPPDSPVFARPQNKDFVSQSTPFAGIGLGSNGTGSSDFAGFGGGPALPGGDFGFLMNGVPEIPTSKEIDMGGMGDDLTF